MGDMTCGVGYATELPIGDVDDWLDENCAGDFDIELTDMVGEKKKVAIRFEKREDLEMFKKKFKKFEKEKLAENQNKPRNQDRGGDSKSSKPKKKGLFGMLRPDKGR